MEPDSFKENRALIGILGIGAATAVVVTLIGASAFGLSWIALLALYSLSGTVATLVVAWRRMRCMEFHDDMRQNAGTKARRAVQ
ncbi:MULTISPECIES: hypothetical protein [unclassified Paracoccus (in: a-proteobacteria)]|uniref:hypothetical protein n=1 Tax=unclassified Paracoccus (in: a-proteobacteria) TaxID=2688777 RepID=UPI0012B38F0D|nr:MULTISPECIES: hypothetical protein [unclassified Paracoccus (in: a-proteobacteria)]UXU76143.1 hypothetical protein GB879_006625 [Paracoccus sp. SMMA_5]UXU82055.1 hypothetical protein GB880_006610 [Paracoccus sp. SMMA_5_TC]